MHFPRSFLACAIFLSFSTNVSAAVARQRRGDRKDDSLALNNGLPGGLPSPVKLRKRQGTEESQEEEELIWEDTPSWRILSNADSEDTKIVCNKLIGPLPPMTVTEDFTPAAVTRTSTGETTRTETSTTRVYTTVTEVVAGEPSLVARAANAAALVQDVFVSLLVAQTTEASPEATDSERSEAIDEMSSACRLIDVDPTSTVTETFTAPPAQTTITRKVQRMETEWVTLAYPITVQVTRTDANQTINGTVPTSISTLVQSSTAVANSSASSVPGTDTSDATAITSAASTSSGSLSTLTSTIISDVSRSPIASGLPGSVVEALPFDCPQHNGKLVTNIVGNKRYEYEVFCDTRAVQADSILTKQVAGPTECAAACSLLNDGLGSDACQLATYTAIPGAGLGECAISGKTESFLPSNGTISILHTATFGAGDESGNCALTDANNSTATGTSSIDSAAVVTSVATATVSIYTPGYITGTTVGGASSTRIWQNTTLSNGAVYWSYNDIYVSSASWYNVYETEWSCATVYAQTVIVPSVGNTTSVAELTTIINGREVTVMNGSSTMIYTQGGSGGLPTAVDASTTSGDIPSTSLSTVVSTTSVQGSASATLSGATLSSNSSGAAGGSTPTSSAVSLSTGAAQFTESGASAATNVTGGSGYGQPNATDSSQILTSGTGVITIPGQTYTANSTGGAGIIPGSASSGDTTVTVRSTIEVTIITETFAPVPTNGQSNFTVSGGTSIIVTGASGGVVNASSTAPIGTGSSVSTGGASNLTVSDETATTIVTGTGGIVLPTTTPSLSASSGSSNLTVGEETAITSLGGGSGVILPSANSSTSTGAANFSTSGATAVTSLGQGSGVILPSSTGTGGFTNDDENRTRGRSSTLNGTVSIGTGTVPSPPLYTGTAPSYSIPSNPANSTALPGTGVSTLIDRPSYGPGDVPANSTSAPGTDQPSITAPPASVNATSTPPANSTDRDFSNTDDGRVPGSRSPSPSQNATSVLPIASGNVTVPVILPTGYSVVPSVPLSTGGSISLSIPGSSVNASSGGGYGSIFVPIPSSNTTFILPTGGSASVTVPGVSANSTALPGTGYSIPTGYGSVSMPVPTVNSSALPGTGVTAPSISPSPSRNFSNTDDARGRGSRTPTGANSTAFIATGTGSGVASTGNPLQSLNSTIPPSLVTGGKSSIPVATPPPYYSATTDEACPTTTSYSVRYITTVLTELVPIAPSTCISRGTGAILPTGNLTAPAPTDASAFPLPTYSTSTTSDAALASASAAALRFRRSDEIATQAQIDAACADTGNIVFNPDFELEDDNAFGWTATADSTFISFRTFPSENQHTEGGRRSGRVLSAAPGSSIVVSTPVTLCPGRQYELSAYNRQADTLAQCSMEYRVGDEGVFIANPQEAWLAQPRREFFVAGENPTAVSVDLSITVTCAGQGGAPVGTNDAGYMVAEFDDVALRQV